MATPARTRVLIAMTAVVAAVAALGVGAIVGSTHATHRSHALTAAPEAGPTPEQLCEQAAEQLRAKHPHAYIGACNSGEGSITP